jgi:hypothetical protein
MNMARISSVVLYALLTAGSAGFLLALNRRFAPQRKPFFDRFTYGFWRFGLPGGCLLEAVWWFTQHRWFP